MLLNYYDIFTYYLNNSEYSFKEFYKLYMSKKIFFEIYFILFLYFKLLLDGNYTISVLINLICECF